ncbi:acyltransferase family protein [Alishewanella sp. HL-SH06]|uniref:acyltransferase family protein n=1 Tax=Alishewanella sp. HL-SH06 TaxID=3461144 RepID=UPI004042157E
MFGVRQHCQAILAQQPAGRLLALDILRGLAIMAMVLVNNPGSWQYIYAPLRHAEWHGWTVTDLIFPAFIIMVGMSIQLSLRQKVAQTKLEVIQAGALRALKLYLLGLFLVLFYYNFRDPAYSYLQQKLLTVRWFGVLQRIALVYFCTLLIVLYCGTRARVLWLVGLCVVYLALMQYMPYQDAQGQQFVGLWQFGNNFAAWLDHQILGAQHVFFRSATPFAFDPEGLLSTLPAISSCLLGVVMAQLLQSDQPLAFKIRLLALAGVAMVWIAELAHPLLPINKMLWTPTFVLLSTGYTALLLAVILWLTEIKRYRLWGAPLVVFGVNAILFFMLAGVAARILSMLPVAGTTLGNALFREVFQPLFGNYNGSLVFALCFLAIAYLGMLVLYRRGFIFKV